MMKQPADAADREVAKLMASLADNVADQDVLVASRLSSLVFRLSDSEVQRAEKIRTTVKSFLTNVRHLPSMKSNSVDGTTTLNH